MNYQLTCIGIVLAACAPEPRSIPMTQNPPLAMPQDACNARQYQYLIGQGLSSAIDIDFKNETRFIGGNGRLLHDPTSTRLNVLTAQDAPIPTAENTIIDVFCG